MIKNMKAVFVILTLAVFCTLLNPVQIKASDEEDIFEVPKEICCGVGGKESAAGQMEVYMGDTDHYIENLKFSSSLVKGTINRTKAKAEKDYISNGDIRVYAKKEGTYSMTFDVYTADGKKYRSCSVKIYAYDGYDNRSYPVDAIKSFTLNGKKVQCQAGQGWGDYGRIVTGLTSAKVEVEFWGYKPKNLVIYTTNKNGKSKKTVVKNGSKIVFSEYGYESPGMKSNDKSDDEYGWVNMKEFYAGTSISIPYKEYSKWPLARYFGMVIYSPATKWTSSRG